MRATHFLAATLAIVTPLVLGLQGCSDPQADTNGDPDAAPPNDGPVLPGPSRGASIALSSDDAVAVVANRDVGSVSIFRVDFPNGGASAAVTKTAEIMLAPGSEPWQVAIGPDNDTAYVVLRRDQKLVRIDHLKSSPARAADVATGSEPTGIALSPTGATAFVANWVDGTVSAIDTASMSLRDSIDLNRALVQTGFVGAVEPRPAIAHPRSLAVTNNLDKNDLDESIYVTEYFAQRTEPEAADGANSDRNKSGLVYKIKLADKSVSTITLAPLGDLGFKDHNGHTTGCYPNQLQSIALQGNYAYVTSTCASPKGPVGVFNGPGGPDVSDVRTTTAPVVSVIELARDREASRASLNARFDALYTTLNTPDDARRRLPSFPSDIAFVPGTGVGYVAANAADGVFRVRYDGAELAEVGASTNAFIDLNPSGIGAAASGKNPVGVAMSNTGKHFMFVANDVSRNVSVVDLNSQAIAGGVGTPVFASSSNLPAPGSNEDHVLRGKRFFNTGTARWSLKGQAWNSCQSCHSDGLTDNVTWYFARGPRQSTSLDGTFSSRNPNDQRILNWTGIFDEFADFELNTRGISGGVGAIVSKASSPPVNTDRIDFQALGHGGLNGSAQQAADKSNPAGLAEPSLLADWDEITAYARTIRSPRGASHLDPAKVAAGRELFTTAGNCQGCHGGDKWTLSQRFYTPSIDTNKALSNTAWTPPSGFPGALLPAATPANRLLRFAGTDPAKAGAFDQIQCVLRPVGTFNVAEARAGIAEVRDNMTTPAQGNEVDGKGFNPPSLLDVGAGAPYLHAGQVDTLEALFDPRFAAHYAAFAPNFLSETDPAARAAKVSQLVHFLLSVDESTDPIVPTVPGISSVFLCSN